jgi:hypothetical protein
MAAPVPTRYDSMIFQLKHLMCTGLSSCVSCFKGIWLAHANPLHFLFQSAELDPGEDSSHTPWVESAHLVWRQRKEM